MKSINKLIKENFILENYLHLMDLYEDMEKEEEFLALNSEIRNKKILIDSKLTFTLNDLFLFQNIISTINVINKDNIISKDNIINKEKSLQFSMSPCMYLTKLIIKNILPNLKDPRFVNLLITKNSKQIEKFNETEKEIISEYLQKFMKVPEKFYPINSENLSLTKNSISVFIKTNNFQELMNFNEIIYEEIFLKADKTKLRFFLRNISKNSNNLNLNDSTNFMALKILLKEKVETKFIEKYFDFFCQKCLKNLQFDKKSLNLIDDWRFLLFDLESLVVYNSFESLKNNKIKISENENCIFYKFCSEKVNYNNLRHLNNFSLVEILCIVFKRKKRFHLKDVQLIKEIDEKYGSDLNFIFRKEIFKVENLSENINFIDFKENEKFTNLFLTYESSLKEYTKNNKENKENKENLIDELKKLNSNERTEFLKILGKKEFYFLRKGEDTVYEIFLEDFFVNSFFDELTVEMIFQNVDISILPEKIKKYGISLKIFEDLLKNILRNSHSYCFFIILKILNISLKKIFSNRKKTAFSKIESKVVESVLNFIKKVLESDFIDGRVVEEIQFICMEVLNLMEFIEDFNKLEIMLEIIYEKVKLKSYLMGKKVQIKNVKF